MDVSLYDLVKKSKHNKRAMKELIDLFEPKLKKSLSLTQYGQREDLEQELKCTLIKSVQRYNVDTIPGFWELKEQFENLKIVLN
ncbi:helix-turn-helix domain-containing protein [Neobacillus jeddahensis]|uniref:helix-turn-helix domain-containing protein n=1 Tax=Neobacillus jeddahensis TaxID=1461580 RepID=UPI000B1B21C6|nr:helix-turn-helix domain-containing protein [Neobacillus jeddahensis]